MLKSPKARGTSRARVRATELLRSQICDLRSQNRIVTKASLNRDSKLQIANLKCGGTSALRKRELKNFCDALMPAVNFMVKPRD